MTKFYADLHIHSRFSRACSKSITLPEMYRWCQLKGISVIGTGDFTHPVWIEEIKNQLEETEQGLFSLKKSYAAKIDKEVPATCAGKVRFLLTVEISLIYKKGDKVRKTHHVILVPSIACAEKLNKELAAIGNLKADGRPILGLDSRDLLEIVLEVDERCMLIPAHIWTPWFSMFGDKSGFDSIEECFGDLSKHIHAIETGLSSDPEMNWMIKDLDRVTIISNSDAHSLPKIAREANIFNCKLSYKDITGAIIRRDSGFKGTIEFYPEQGKYHHDGHRKCGINWSPEETIKHDAICPKCGKRVTVGVSNRVYSLAKRKKGKKSANSRPYVYAVPLKEILSEILDKGVNTKTVGNEYFKILSKFGNELSVALDVSVKDLSRYSPILAEAVLRIREGNLQIEPGYDGVFGKVSIFTDKEKEAFEHQSQMRIV